MSRGRGLRGPVPAPGEELQAVNNSARPKDPVDPLASPPLFLTPPSLLEWTQAWRRSQRVPEGWWQVGACDPMTTRWQQTATRRGGASLPGATSLSQETLLTEGPGLQAPLCVLCSCPRFLSVKCV